MRGIYCVRQGACRRERSKGTLTEGKENGRIKDQNRKISRRRRGKRKFGRESQAAGDEPYRGKSRLGKRNRGEGTLKKRGNLTGYATGISNESEEEEEKEYAARIRKQPERNLVGRKKG